MEKSKLFSEITIGNLQLKNRIVVPPMCQYSADNGLASDWHLVHYSGLAFSNPGLLIFEAAAISPEGRISYADLGLWDEDTANALKRITRFIKQHCNTPLAVQISHAGRKASTEVPWKGLQSLPIGHPGGWQTYAPSAIAQSTGGTVPLALSEDEITGIIGQFATSAKFAEKAGFDAIELHAAHGYLIHQFLSPVTNHRHDTLGGCLENRMRFGLEVVKAVKKAVSKTTPVGVRISAVDWVENGWNIEESICFAKELEALGIAYIHVSSGGIDNGLQQLPPLTTGYQLPLAEAIRKAVSIPVIGVGLITNPLDAESALQAEKADLIAVGRGYLFNPHWSWLAAGILNSQADAPSPYMRSAPREFKDIFQNNK